MARLLGLVLTLAGMGVGLVALAPEHFNRPVADFAYFIGLGFLWRPAWSSWFHSCCDRSAWRQKPCRLI